MQTEIKWAELHSPLFLAGANLGMKLDPTKRAGLLMNYDEDKRHLYVTYTLSGVTSTARVPEPSILSMVEGAPTVRPVVAAVTPTGKPIKAQVGGPSDHVFGGPGAGRTK